MLTTFKSEICGNMAEWSKAPESGLYWFIWSERARVRIPLLSSRRCSLFFLLALDFAIQEDNEYNKTSRLFCANMKIKRNIGSIIKRKRSNKTQNMYYQ